MTSRTQTRLRDGRVAFAMVGIVALTAGGSGTLPGAQGMQRYGVRPESRRWSMDMATGWMGGGRTQIQQDAARASEGLRAFLSPLAETASRHDAVLLHLDPVQPQGSHPTLLYLDYSSHTGIPLETLQAMMAQFGTGLGQQYLVGGGRCEHESVRDRRVAGFRSLRGTFRCMTSTRQSVFMVFEQIELPEGAEIAAILQADDLVRQPRLRDLDQMLESIRLSP